MEKEAAEFLEKGKRCLRQGDPAAAEKNFRLVLRLDASCQDALTGLGDALENEGDFTRARQIYEQALRSVQGEPEKAYVVRRRLAMVSLIEGNYLDAADMLRRGNGIGSDYESQVLLSKIYLRAGHAQDAVRILELMLSRWPGHQAELIWRTACIQAAFLGKESRGLHMVKNLYRTDPDRLEYIEIYMYFLAVHRRDFIRINRISRDVPGLYRGGYYGGDILIPFELRTHFNERRIALNIYRYVMQAKWQLGMREEAARLLHNLDYRLGVDADRTRSGVSDRNRFLYNYGCCRLYGGDTGRAMSTFREMLQNYRCRCCSWRECYKAWLGMGLVRLERGDADGAFPCFQKALDINPVNALCRYYGKVKRNRL